jgi:hypothetical protein
MLISKTYETVTPESAEHGDIEDSGFDYENENFTFKEFLHEIETSGCIYSEGCTWLYSEPQIEDYGTCETKSYALHYSRKNAPRNQKYWDKAITYIQNKYK